MGKKGNKRKTRWRVLPIGGDNGDSLCSTNDEEGDGDHVSSSPTTPVNGSWSNGRPPFSPRGPAKVGKQRLGYQQSSYRQHPQRGGYNDSKQPVVTTEKKTFNEEEYTKITTPRQDVLFKKGYLGRKKPALTNATNSADTNPAPPTENAGVPDHEQTEPPETPHFVYTNGYVDQGGLYYINGGSYELYDPYTGNVTVVVAPAHHGPPVLAAVSCQPVPLQPLEWFNPAFHSYVTTACPDRRKRSSTDSQNWSPQSSESTDPPGSPQEGEDVGLQNGGAESLEDCTAYQHTHQPPAYVYPGYMFGPAVYNMNGINIQTLPPPPQSIDISGSKRRKKKRRRRRRRGGIDDGSDESTSDENELEEPLSVTSQESSQEAESDSRNSAGSSTCKAGSGEANSSENTSETSANYAQVNSAVLLENNNPGLSGVVDSPTINLQPEVDENPRSAVTEESKDNKDIPVTNTSASNTCAGTSKNVVNEQQDLHANHEVPLSTPVSKTVQVQTSCNGNISNDVLHLECHDAINTNGPLIVSPHVSQNSPCNNTDTSGICGAGNTKEKNKSRKASKHNKQKHQQSGFTDCAEDQPTHVQSQIPSQKMEGKESSKIRNSNNGKGSTDDHTDAEIKTKPLPSRSDQLKSSTAARVTDRGDCSTTTDRHSTPRDPPKKPSRKDYGQQQKLTQKKGSVTVHKEVKERAGPPKVSKHQTECHSKDPTEKHGASQDVPTSRTVSQSDECDDQSVFDTEICTLVPTQLVGNTDHLHLEYAISSEVGDEESKEYPTSDERQHGFDESATIAKGNIVSSSPLERSPEVWDKIGETQKENVESCRLANVVYKTEVFPRVSADPGSEMIERDLREYTMSTKERHSPPPIPPPRRKKWHPCNKRPSTERPPTPGRDLEDRRSSEVLTDDSSSTSTSRESEESVIENISSTRSGQCKDVSIVARHSSEGEEEVISDAQQFPSTSPPTLQNTVLEMSFSAQNPIPSHEDGNFTNQLIHFTDNLPHGEVISSNTIAQTSPAMGQSKFIPQLQSSDYTSDSLDRSLANRFLHGFGDSSPETKNYTICMEKLEKFSNEMASRVIKEALLTVMNSKSEQALAWPITEAVTRWLRAQSTEEVLSVPELRDSESDSIEEIEEENSNGAKAIEDNTAGPKNVLRNPLPALSHECLCKSDNGGIRVATNNSEVNHLREHDKSYLTNTSQINHKIHDINNNKNNTNIKHAITRSKEMNENSSEILTPRSDRGHDTCGIICPTESRDIVMLNNELLSTEESVRSDHQGDSCISSEDDIMTFNSVQDDRDSIFTSESAEYDTDWECDAVTLKPSPQVSSMYVGDSNLHSESPDNRCLHMCDPALSVAKYYRLGPPADKADVVSQDQMTNSYTESEEETDSLEQFRNELYDSAYDSCHRSLADELQFCEKPLPESWSIDHIKVSQENIDVTPSIFMMKYDGCKVTDSGIQSEESGNEDSRKQTTNSSSIFSNSSKLFNRNSAIHMTGISTEGPFPCGGICCILQ